MPLYHRLHERCGLCEGTREHLASAESRVRTDCRCLQGADIADSGGPAVAGDGRRVYEDQILERYRLLSAQRSASSRIASSYSSKNSATNSITSGDGLFTVGSTRMPPPSESTNTLKPGSQRNSRSISAGIGTITDPPTFFNSRSIFIRSSPLVFVIQSITYWRRSSDRGGYSNGRTMSDDGNHACGRFSRTATTSNTTSRASLLRARRYGELLAKRLRSGSRLPPGPWDLLRGTLLPRWIRRCDGGSEGRAGCAPGSPPRRRLRMPLVFRPSRALRRAC